MKSIRAATVTRAIILVVFLLSATLIGFTHTEKTPLDESRCVACHFLGLLLQTAPSLFVLLISFFLFSTIRPARVLSRVATFFSTCLLRAPPTA